MSENLPGGTAHMNELVESILNLEFPGKQVMEAMASYVKPPDTPNAYFQKVEARRLALQKVPHAQLVVLRSQLIAAQQEAHLKAQEAKKAKAAAKAAEREAARFYNQPQAHADFDFWARMEHWTPEEAIALLLGRNPRLVTIKAVLREIEETEMLLGPPMTKFLTDYEELRALASRAAAMTGPQLRPAAVLAWAQERSRLAPPVGLVDAVARFAGTRQPNAVEPAAAPLAPVPQPSTPAQAARQSVAKGAKRDALTPVIELAQEQCTDPFDAAAVWGQLLAMAERQQPPLRGATEEGIQYLKDGTAAILTREALAKRVGRARGRQV